MTVTCYEITHAGEGEPGRSVQFEPSTVCWINDAQDYAERAAHYFYDADDDHEGSRVIEVHGLPGGPQRFRVRCEVVRRYTATKLEA